MRERSGKGKRNEKKKKKKSRKQENIITRPKIVFMNSACVFFSAVSATVLEFLLAGLWVVRVRAGWGVSFHSSNEQIFHLRRLSRRKQPGNFVSLSIMKEKLRKEKQKLQKKKREKKIEGNGKGS